jgi:uncharacterized protein (TIGR03437 family)
MSGREIRSKAVVPGLRLLITMLLALATLGLGGFRGGAQGAAKLDLQPYLQDLGQDHVTILWTTTGEAGQGSVKYSSDAGVTWRTATSSTRVYPASQTSLAEAFYQHRVELRNLQPATEYLYRIQLDGADPLASTVTSALRFRTSAPIGAFSFLALGDSGDGGTGQGVLALQMASENPSFVIHTGDIAYEDGTFGQYRSFYFEPYRALLPKWTFFDVAGNHDYYFRDAEAFRAYFSPPTAGIPALGVGTVYSYDWADAHIVVIDSNTPLNDAIQGRDWMLRWLEADLAATKQAWRIVSFHHPPFPTAVHMDDPLCIAARDLIAPILERQSVQLVLNGHEHNYQRLLPRLDGAFRSTGPGTLYITTGGGGSRTYPSQASAYLAATAPVSHYLRAEAAASLMQISSIGVDGALIDSVSITASPSIPRDGVRDGAEFATAVAPGGLITIFGWNLAPREATATGIPLPKELEGVRVLANGQAIPLLYVSRRQINAQLPFGIKVTDVQLRVESPAGAHEVAQAVREAAPAVFQVRSGPQNRTVPAVVNTAYQLITPESPAHAGEVVSVFVTGLGKVQGNAVEGSAAPASQTLSTVRVKVGRSDGQVLYAGLAPGWAGLYQINMRLPASTTGVQELRVEEDTSTGTVSSARFSLTIQ